MNEQTNSLAGRIEELEQHLDTTIDVLKQTRAEHAGQLAELEAISAALGTNEGHSSVYWIEALIADNDRLRGALENYAEPRLGYGDFYTSALSVTPAQSLARIRNQVREECAELMERQHAWITPVAASALIRAIKERLQKERDDLIQTSFDLCPECGWRTLIPTEGCIKCSAASVETEREECAKACDTIAEDWRGANSQAKECATAIRNRGTK